MKTPEDKTLLDLSDEALTQIGKYSSSAVLEVLSADNVRLYFIYKQELAYKKEAETKRAAQQLMAYVLDPTAENIAMAKSLIAAKPYLMFMKTEGIEKASGVEAYVDEVTGETRTRVVHRTVLNCSPFQAALGTGDSEIYKYMATHFDKVTYKGEDGKVAETGIQRALAQINEKFPHGFAYPAIDQEFKNRMDAIFIAVEHDLSLSSTNTPSEQTKAMLDKFRKDFMLREVTEGHHFNLLHLKEVLECYKNYNNTYPNERKKELLWCQVVGWFERQAPIVIAQAFCGGIKEHITQDEQNLPYERSLMISTRGIPTFNSPACNISYDSTDAVDSGLGFDYGIEIDLSRGRASSGSTACKTAYSDPEVIEFLPTPIEILCNAKVAALERFHKEVKDKATLNPTVASPGSPSLKA